MDIKQMALHLYPYWITGACVLLATWLAGKKDLIRIEKPAVIDWIKFLAVVTVYRFVLFKLFPHFSIFQEAAKNISQIPTPLTLTVFWEDACHGLPLLMLKNFVKDKKWLKWLFPVCCGILMLEFALGHVYQGIWAAALLSLYIPYSVKLGEKYGFGTVMVCHTLFDLTTIISMKMLLGG